MRKKPQKTVLVNGKQNVNQLETKVTLTCAMLLSLLSKVQKS